MFFQVFQRKHSLTLLPKGGGPRIKPRSILTDHTKAPSVHLRHQWAGWTLAWVKGTPGDAGGRTTDKASLIHQNRTSLYFPHWPSLSHCLNFTLSDTRGEHNIRNGEIHYIKKKKKKEYETPFLMLTLVFSSMVYNPLCCLTQTNTAGASKTDWRFTKLVMKFKTKTALMQSRHSHLNK